MNGMIRRVVVYILGLWILAVGVAFSVNSNLGVSPVNSLPKVVCSILEDRGYEVTLGTCVIAVFSLFIVAQIVVLRKEFPIKNLAQILCSTMFGYFTDLSKKMLGGFVLPTYFGQLTMLLISIILIAIGIFLYINADLINMPMEGLTQALAQKVFKKRRFNEVKVIVDCVTVAVGIVVSFLFLGRLAGIREGTVLSAILIGKVMKPLQKHWGAKVRQFCLLSDT